MPRQLKRVDYIGSSKDDLEAMPVEVRETIAQALYQAQAGGKHYKAKPLKGFKGASVLEIVVRFSGDAFRTVYAIGFTDRICVLHCFQKKSKHGIAMERKDIKLINQRLAQARGVK